MIKLQLATERLQGKGSTHQVSGSGSNTWDRWCWLSLAAGLETPLMYVYFTLQFAELEYTSNIKFQSQLHIREGGWAMLWLIMDNDMDFVQFGHTK